MLEALEDLLKEFQKNNQKTQVLTIGMQNIRMGEVADKKIRKTGKEEIKMARSSVSKTSSHLQEAIKGHFGKKVTEVFEKQEDMLENF
ncbi:hypothetical protein [Listeria welshimeri]|uniref:hypothetical protein n=1 Tax=Listeria welshimeri TaxID=1643 RepID=UPI0016241C91|nr:hypothetical protein [Listeria welshimeri]MBC1318594.1 hypothetical protein [Listeria welshimeri]MBC1360237.1 hypothetical protein [Listeria welshimeri]MBC1389345.1 hypothetical protein [Listeria welshimeri]MBC1685135.1 hypothetical protein [Listeria welshimeri]MBC1954986.1 hypothetical protein [Listeria welshimeri]